MTLQDVSPSHSVSQPAPAEDLYDAIIVGAGAAGASAAVVLARQNRRIALIDLNPVCRNEFRAEKFAGDQIELVRRLGLFDALSPRAERVTEAVNIRNGKLVDRTPVEAYNLPYEELVNGIRNVIPPEVDQFVQRVSELVTSDDVQIVRLSNGTEIRGRLIILATGHADGLRDALGMRKRMLRGVHSVSFGFDVVQTEPAAPRIECLTAYGSQTSDRIDYLAIFRFPNGLRANLFVYRDLRDPWLKRMVAEPKSVLLESIPGLTSYLGQFDVVGKVSIRPMDLYEIDNYLQPGVVLLGDAFRSGCPAVGHGLSRTFNDVDRLCNTHLPRWLETPGMSVSKITDFYEDPVKRERDARAARLAEYRRDAAIQTNLRWTLHRSRVYLQRKIRARIEELRRA